MRIGVWGTGDIFFDVDMFIVCPRLSKRRSVFRKTPKGELISYKESRASPYGVAVYPDRSIEVWTKK